MFSTSVGKPSGERWAKKASERGRPLCGRGPNHGGEPRGVLMRKMTKISEDLPGRPGRLHNSHTDLAAGAIEGAALSGSALKKFAGVRVLPGQRGPIAGRGSR